MDQPGSSQPPPSSSTTANPVVAVGRKVKSIFSSHQQPSIRILREPSSTGAPRRPPISKDFAEKPLPPLPPRGNVQGPESPPDLPTQDAVEWEASHVPTRERTFSNRFAGARTRAGSVVQSMFSRNENVTEHPECLEDCYDTETVDLLDVMGMYGRPILKASELTLPRPRGSYLVDTHERPKFPLRPLPREIR
jgi:hypothetical protein